MLGLWVFTASSITGAVSKNFLPPTLQPLNTSLLQPTLRYQLAVTKLSNPLSQPKGRATSSEVRVRQVTKKRVITKKTPSFAPLPVVQLRAHANQCHVVPNIWAFVSGVGSTYSDYATLLVKLSGDSTAVVSSELKIANKGKNLNNQPFFSYIRIPPKYYDLFQGKYSHVIEKYNSIPGCKPAARMARVFVVPEVLSVQTLTHALGSRQQESTVLLANQLSMLNSDIRPGRSVPKGSYVLLPQAYPYSNIAGRQLPSQPIPEIDETFVEDQRSSGIQRHSFFWSFGTYSLSSRITGVDNNTGGSLDLVSDSASINQGRLGYDFDKSAGQLSALLQVDQRTLSYRKPVGVTLNNTEINNTSVSIAGYLQPSDADLGYGFHIGRLHVVDTIRTERSVIGVINPESTFIDLFVRYEPGQRFFGVGYGLLAGGNILIGSGDLKGEASYQFGGNVGLALGDEYALHFDFMITNMSYKTGSRSLQSNDVSLGVSLHGW